MSRTEWLRWWRWVFVAPAPFWLGIGGFCAAGVGGALLARLQSSPTPVENAGHLLELFALLFVAQRLRSLHFRYGGRSFDEWRTAWLSDLPWRESQARNATLHASSLGSATAFGRARVRTKGETIERQLELLVEQLDDLEDRIDRNEDALAREAKSLREEIDQVRRDAATEIERVRGDVRESVGGGMPYEMVGILWLIVGAVLANLRSPFERFPWESLVALGYIVLIVFVIAFLGRRNSD